MKKTGMVSVFIYRS